MFEKTCPHYESREYIQKNSPTTVLPENEKLHWCGEKGEWIEKCDEPCKGYELFLKAATRRIPTILNR